MPARLKVLTPEQLEGADAASDTSARILGSRFRSVRAPAGKSRTEKSPAAITAAPLAGVIRSSSSPIEVAAMMKGSEVA